MRRLRWHDHLAINIFWLGLNIRNNAVGSILMPYLVAGFVAGDVMNTALGAMRTAGLVIAMLVQPAMGLLSDRSMSRFGRRRPFIFVGVLLDLIFLVAMALTGSYWGLLVAILLLQFSSNMSHGAVQGLIPDLVPENQRGRSSAVKSIMELAPLVLLAFTVAKLVGAGKIGWATAATGAGLLATMLLAMVFVREAPLRERPTGPLKPPMVRVLGMLAGIAAGAAAGLVAGGVVGGVAGIVVWTFAGARTAQAVGVALGGAVAMAVAVVAGVWAGSLTTLGKDARKEASFTWWVVNRLFFLAAVTSVQGFTPYFLMYAFNMTREGAADQTGSLMMVVGLLTLVTALPSGWLADRFGQRRLVALSGLIAAAGTALLLSTIWAPNLTLIYVAGAIIGLATGLFVTVNWALGTALAPQAEAGRYLGISNLAGAGAGMIGAGLGGPLADYLNRFQPGLGYFVIFACYAVLFALSAISLVKVRGARVVG